jgi:hypothetical protein
VSVLEQIHFTNYRRRFSLGEKIHKSAMKYFDEECRQNELHQLFEE